MAFIAVAAVPAAMTGVAAAYWWLRSPAPTSSTPTVTPASDTELKQALLSEIKVAQIQRNISIAQEQSATSRMEATTTQTQPDPQSSASPAAAPALAPPPLSNNNSLLLLPPLTLSRQRRDLPMETKKLFSEVMNQVAQGERRKPLRMITEDQRRLDAEERLKRQQPPIISPALAKRLESIRARFE